MKHVLHRHLVRIIGIVLFVGMSGFSATALAGVCGPGEVFVVDRVVITPTEVYYYGHCAPKETHKPHL